jgi:hypothetical protein
MTIGERYHLSGHIFIFQNNSLTNKTLAYVKKNVKLLLSCKLFIDVSCLCFFY